jgi:hypothetical protein
LGATADRFEGVEMKSRTLARVSLIPLATALALGLVCFGPARAAGGTSSSSSYILHQSTVDSGGQKIVSGMYRLDASLGQQASIGTSSSPTYVLQSGFWAFVGTGIVPVILTVQVSSTTEGDLDLVWSGNNPPYTVYESADCANIFDWFIGTTTTNGLTVTPLAEDLVCYRVLPTAPGP